MSACNKCINVVTSKQPSTDRHQSFCRQRVESTEVTGGVILQLTKKDLQVKEYILQVETANVK